MLASVGVVVFTLREMQLVDRCVESVRWADAVQLWALDDDDPGRADFDRHGTDWVLYLFGEEHVDAELSSAIQNVLRSRSQQSREPYGIRVRSRLLDRWIEASCWGPCPSPRLLPADRAVPFEGWQSAGLGRWTGQVLPGWISDHSFDPVANGIGYVNELSTIWARGTTDVPRGPKDLTLLAAQAFSWLFVRRRLWLQGLPGFSIAVIAAYTCVATAMKSWEKGQGPVHGPPIEP